jgi:protein-disulfide isomerase
MLGVWGLLLALVLCTGQPIPRLGYDGIFFGSRTATIQLQVFLDLLCSDCKDAWPALKAVQAHYGDKMGLTLHTFPLPYHRYAALAAQGGAFVATTRGPNAWAAYADLLFSEHQDTFLNGATANVTADAVAERLGLLVQNALAIAATEFITCAYKDRTFDDASRISFKYGASRGIFGTPSFLVNDVRVDGQSTWTLKDWRRVLDPLLSLKKEEIGRVIGLATD